MLLQVGSALRWRGKRWIVTRVDHNHSLLRATDSQLDWVPATLGRQENVSYMFVDAEPYEVGDIIEREDRYVRLETEGTVAYIYTLVKIKRIARGEQDSDTRRSEGTAEAPTDQTGATGGQPASWEDFRFPGLGEDGEAHDGPGEVQGQAGDPGGR